MYTLLNGHLGNKTKIVLQARNVSIGTTDVAGLHRLHLQACLSSGFLLDNPDEIHQCHRTRMPHIIDRVRNGLARRVSGHEQHGVDHIVDIGKITLHITMVEHMNRGVQSRKTSVEQRGTNNPTIPLLNTARNI